MPPRMVHELPVTRMVHGLDSNNFLHERGNVMTNVLDQLRFLVRGARHEDRSRIRDGFRHTLQEIVILGRVSASDQFQSPWT